MEKESNISLGGTIVYFKRCKKWFERLKWGKWGVGDVVWWSVVFNSTVQKQAKQAQNKSMETTILTSFGVLHTQNTGKNQL